MNTETQGDERAVYHAKNQTYLIYLLLLLHPLFGITALIAALVGHMKKAVTDNTVFATHRVWQLVTFWFGLLGYVAGVYYILRMGSYVIVVVTFLRINYRLWRGWLNARKHEPVGPPKLS